MKPTKWIVLVLLTILLTTPTLAQENRFEGTINDEDWFVRYDLGELSTGTTISAEAIVTSGDITVYMNLWPSGSEMPIEFGTSFTFTIEEDNSYLIDVVREYGSSGTFDIIYSVDDIAPLENNAVTRLNNALEQGCTVTAVPEELGLDPFYEKYCDLAGVPVISSGEVPDVALQSAWFLAANMFSAYPEGIDGFIADDIRIGIMADTEVTTDMPEHSDLNAVFSDVNWDTRARGLGATRVRPLVSGAEENIMCYQDDVYRGENIFLHEFSHSFKDFGINAVDVDFQRELEDIYDDAMQAGLWIDTYTATNPEEYWAEGVQSYFNANIYMPATDRQTLSAYDPDLFELIDGIFAGIDWQPSCGCRADVTDATLYQSVDGNILPEETTAGEQLIIGQSTEGDWYRLATGDWVQANDVSTVGDCEELGIQ